MYIIIIIIIIISYVIVKQEILTCYLKRQLPIIREACYAAARTVL